MSAYGGQTLGMLGDAGAAATENTLEHSEGNVAVEALNQEVKAADQAAEESAGRLQKLQAERDAELARRGGFAQDASGNVVDKDALEQSNKKIAKLEEDLKEVEKEHKGNLDRKKMARDKLDYSQTRMGKFKNFAAEAPGKLGRGLLGAASHVVETLVSAVLFMIPNIFQSGMLAQKQRMVELQTLAAPIKFGDMVLQIPDSCINMSNPSSSIPVYVRIPVANVRDEVGMPAFNYCSKAISAGAPTDKNAVSSAIHTFGEDVFSFGAAAGQGVQRYRIYNESQFYDKSGMVVAFSPPGSYGSPASSTLTSSQFAGLVVDLNTGYVMDASGEQNSLWPLINLTVNGTDPHGNPYGGTPVSVKDFLPLELSKLGLSGNKVTYTQYQNVTSGSHGNNVSPAMQRQFDCACIDETSDSTVTCSTGAGCLLKKSLDAYASGLFLNAAGTAAVDTPGAVVVPGLGSVVPMFGWGDTNLVTPSMFPNNTPVDASQYNLITKLPAGKSGFWSGSATSTKSVKRVVKNVSAPDIEYADASMNYGAQGCWVYICANTDFAHALQLQEGGGKKAVEESVHGPLVDYIIFLDETGSNQVPLVAPVMQPIVPGSSVMWPTVGLNPAIKYWASLISSGIESFDQDGGAVMYDLQGNAYANPALASTVIPAAIAELSSYKSPQTGNAVTTFPNLASQLTIHTQALLSKFYFGPFKYGHAELTESKQQVSVAAGSSGGAASTVNFYEGTKCFASPVADLLLPMDSSGNTATLPDSNVVSFYSLVTDISYKVLPDGSLQASDFSQAPITKTGSTYTINQSAKDTFNIVSMLSSSTSAAAVADVAKYVKQQREVWLNNFDNSSQAQGFNLGALAFNLALGLSTKQALANSCFIYEVTPSPSAALTNQDLYVLVDAGQSTLETLTPISATTAGSTAQVVSLITGNIYDTQGNQVLDATGAPIVLTSTTENSQKVLCELVYDYLTTKFPVGKGMTAAFEAKYKSLADYYAKDMHRPMGPYTFGQLHLSLYKGDMAKGNFVYFPAAGMHQKDYQPTDMFVTVDLKQNPPAFGARLDGSTQHVLSLVSGQLYASTGPVSVLPQEKLLALTQQISTKWGSWLNSNVTRLQKESSERMAAQASEQADVDAAYAKIASSRVLLTAASAQAIIKSLTPTGLLGLPAPYSDLKYDAITGNYVRFSPASPTDASALMYQFFDVQNNYEVNGKPVQMGAVFTQTGKQVRVVQGIEQKATCDQYGVVVANGKQTLGVPLLKPSLLMTDTDKDLVPGQSGDSMIVSSDASFPGANIKLANGYYLYFSKIMGVYYAFETKTKQWISIEGGNLYEKDGTPVKKQNRVAKVSGKAGEDDMILLYENAAGFTQGYIDGANFKNIDNITGAMQWVSTSGQNETLTVNENRTKLSYKVGDKTYSVNSSYVWNPMMLVPIDDAGNILTALPNESYNSAQLVLNKKQVSHLMFNKQLYKATSAASASAKPADAGLASAPAPIIMTQVGGSNTIQLSMGVDSGTLAPFVVVADGAASYKYGFEFDQLDDAQQKVYQASKWKGTVVPCPVAMPVGPMHSETKSVGGKSVTISVPDETTYSLFIKNLPSVSSLKPVASIVGAPAATSPNGQLFGINIFRVLKSADGRYVAKMYPGDDNNPMHAPVVSYFNSNGYVDLQTGALFDETGTAVGYSLSVKDWLAVLDKVQVCVMNNAQGVAQLVYRSAQTVKAQTNTLVADAQGAVIGARAAA